MFLCWPNFLLHRTCSPPDHKCRWQWSTYVFSHHFTEDTTRKCFHLGIKVGMVYYCQFWRWGMNCTLADYYELFYRMHFLSFTAHRVGCLASATLQYAFFSSLLHFHHWLLFPFWILFELLLLISKPSHFLTPSYLKFSYLSALPPTLSCWDIFLG